ncbi:MAG: quinone-dependent dihydroorotate dehydrogenase [Chloroflexi bacterium]|nr:quinone-dependent dihydroorotate dehydrogenase [Chloroflexota bacterium]
MYERIRPLLFRLDAERAHHLTLALLRLAGNLPLTEVFLRRLFPCEDPRLAVEAFGLRFKNPIGLAAGYDKNGVALRALSGLGFGHIEIGTVTRSAQTGNPRPRIVRVAGSGALINSMGFPNAGVEAILPALRRRGDNRGIRLGINIGKSKDTPLERAAEDYVALLKRVHPLADYVAINVSSPNTPGLRDLQSRAAINDLLRAVTRARDDLTPRVPLLVKISPDLSASELDDILEAVTDCGLDGIIATNTTLNRAGVHGEPVEPRATIPGGLSGAPLRARATDVIRTIAEKTRGALPVIGVGGVFDAADALEKLRAGARLVQIYTGLVYRGPALAGEINRELVRVCEREGLKHIGEVWRGA